MREMKDSGIEWIGKIPKEWEIAKLKNVCTRIVVGLATSVTQYYQDDGIPMFRNLNIKETGLDTEDVLFLNPEWAEKQEGKKIHTDDILTVHTGYIGISCLVPKDYDDCLTFTTLISTVDNKYAIPKYINYWINISRFFSLIYKSVDTGAQINLNIAEFVNLETVVPPLLVQQSVVNYLDEKCTKIDAIIEKQQEIIERLKEYKLSVITETVTKGLNPDVEMKDSGVDLCETIPAHWKVLQNRYLFSLRDEKNYKPLEEVQLLSLYTDLGVFPHGEQEERGNKAVKAEGYKVVYEDDIIVNIILAWMGAIGRSAYSGVTSPAYDIYKPMEDVCSRYYHYLYRTKIYSGECYKYGRGIMAMRWRTYSSEFKSIKVPTPPYEEQVEIANYLDEKCELIDKTIEERQQAIDKLLDYKKSLIYEVVTGKKEV